MAQNVGSLDSTLRIGMGFALMFAGFLMPEPMSWAAFVGFVILAFTGFSGKCLLYSALGINTCDKEPG